MDTSSRSPPLLRHPIPQRVTPSATAFQRAGGILRSYPTSVPPPDCRTASPIIHKTRPRSSVHFSTDPPQVFQYPAAPHDNDRESPRPKAKLFLPWSDPNAASTTSSA